jgi:hypothetical protein
MVFSGIFPPQELTPAPCGLLGVADTTTHSGAVNDERWIRGFNAEFDTNPQSVEIVAALNGNVEGGTLYEPLDSAEDFVPVAPFYVEVRSKQSGMGLVGDDPEARILRQLEAVTQKAVERELWSGPAARSDESDNLYLAKADSAEVLSTTGVNPKKAMYLAEQAIGDSATGGGGVIHMTRDVAAALFGGNLVSATDEEGQVSITTSLGTPVVVGSGYTGEGPIGHAGAAPSDTNKWVYVTGPVTVHLGQGSVTTDGYAQGFNTNKNDLELQALRPASVHFDPSIFYAIQVAIPDVP